MEKELQERLKEHWKTMNQVKLDLGVSEEVALQLMIYHKVSLIEDLLHYNSDSHPSTSSE